MVLDCWSDDLIKSDHLVTSLSVCLRGGSMACHSRVEIVMVLAVVSVCVWKDEGADIFFLNLKWKKVKEKEKFYIYIYNSACINGPEVWK